VSTTSSCSVPASGTVTYTPSLDVMSATSAWLTGRSYCPRDARDNRVVARLDGLARVEREHDDDAEARVCRHAHVEALARAGRELVGRTIVAKMDEGAELVRRRHVRRRPVEQLVG
jgi:hypothetical protein